MRHTMVSNRASALEESVTIQLNTKAKELQNKGVNVLNLTAGELDFATPMLIQSFVRTQLDANTYTPTLGLPLLREQLAQYVSRVYGIPLTSNHIGVTAGAKQALFEVFQVMLNPGDEVIIPTPYWMSYEYQVRLAGGIPVFVPLTNTFDLDPRAVKKVITKKTKALVINSPHNPTGAVFSRRAVRESVRAVERANAFIVVDDIYRSLVYTSLYSSPVKEIRVLDHLILIDGFSKSHALTGWRIGYVVANPDIIRAIGAFQSHTSGNASRVAQNAALVCLRSDKDAKRFVTVLRRRKRLVSQALSRTQRISFIEPAGAFYVFVRVADVEPNSMRFCERLLEEAHVALVPGEAFGCPGYVRMSFAADDRILRSACKALSLFIQHYI